MRPGGGGHDPSVVALRVQRPPPPAPTADHNNKPPNIRSLPDPPRATWRRPVVLMCCRRTSLLRAKFPRAWQACARALGRTLGMDNTLNRTSVARPAKSEE